MNGYKKSSPILKPTFIERASKQAIFVVLNKNYPKSTFYDEPRFQSIYTRLIVYRDVLCREISTFEFYIIKNKRNKMRNDIRKLLNEQGKKRIHKHKMRLDAIMNFLIYAHANRTFKIEIMKDCGLVDDDVEYITETYDAINIRSVGSGAGRGAGRGAKRGAKHGAKRGEDRGAKRGEKRGEKRDAVRGAKRVE